jgi:hypothetical protein
MALDKMILYYPIPKFSCIESSLLATEFKASLGHFSNHIMVQPFKIEGNYLHLLRSLSPTGEKDITKCRFLRTSSINKCCMFSRDSKIPRSLIISRISLNISSWSSKAIRFGTSPEFRILFTSSK